MVRDAHQGGALLTMKPEEFRAFDTIVLMCCVIQNEGVLCRGGFETRPYYYSHRRMTRGSMHCRRLKRLWPRSSAQQDFLALLRSSPDQLCSGEIAAGRQRLWVGPSEIFVKEKLD